MNTNTISSLLLLDKRPGFSCRFPIVRKIEFSAHRGLFTRGDSSHSRLHRAFRYAALYVLAAFLMVLVNVPIAGHAADSLGIQFVRSGSDGPGYSTNRTSTDVPLQVSSSTSVSSGDVTIALNGYNATFRATSFAIYDENGYLTAGGGGDVNCFASSGQTMTITTANPALDGNAGTLEINYSINGTFSPGHHAIPYGGGDNFEVVVNGFHFLAGYQQNGGLFPQTIPGSLSVTQAITFSSSGTDVPLYMNVTAGIAADTLPSRGIAERRESTSTLQVAVRVDTIRVLDSNGNTVNSTNTAWAGSGRGSNISSNSPYESFSLSNTTNHGHFGSTLTLLDGIASSNTSVQASFAGPLVKIHPVSDAVNFSGTGSDQFVIQLNYDPAIAQAVFGSAATLGLAWLNPTTGEWVNAVLGNSGGTAQFFSRAYDATKDFHLGNFGLDTITKTVWAVLNHNSQFVVTDLRTLQVPSITRLADGHIFFQFAGAPNAVNYVEASPDLSPGSFVPVTSFLTGPSGAVGYEDADAGTLSKRFYRISSP